MGQDEPPVPPVRPAPPAPPLAPPVPGVPPLGPPLPATASRAKLPPAPPETGASMRAPPPAPLGPMPLASPPGPPPTPGDAAPTSGCPPAPSGMRSPLLLSEQPSSSQAANTLIHHRTDRFIVMARDLSLDEVSAQLRSVRPELPAQQAAAALGVIPATPLLERPYFGNRPGRGTPTFLPVRASSPSGQRSTSWPGERARLAPSGAEAGMAWARRVRPRRRRPGDRGASRSGPRRSRP
jgi:hypothetical protein